MKISGIELTTLVEHDKSGQLLLLTSDSNLTGTGELAAVDGDHTDRSTVVVADLLVGRDPFDVEALLIDAKHPSDGTINDIALISAATSAMLDLAGQSLGTSIDQLLAGRVRDQARACAVDWARGQTGNEQLALAARETVAAGFTMLRVEAFLMDEPTDLDVAVERLQAIRSAVADDIDLVVSAQQRLTPSEAEEFADALRSVEPLWLEDLVASWLSEPLRRVSERLNQPLAAGRGTRPDVLRDLAQASLVDHLIVEIGCVGGLLEARRIAALAEIYHIGVIPTGSGGTVSLRDALQLAAVVPNLSVVEVPRGLATVKGGMIAVGGTPAGHTSPSETELDAGS